MKSTGLALSQVKTIATALAAAVMAAVATLQGRRYLAAVGKETMPMMGVVALHAEMLSR